MGRRLIEIKLNLNGAGHAIGGVYKPKSRYKKRGRMGGGKVAKSKKQEKRSGAKSPPPLFF